MEKAKAKGIKIGRPEIPLFIKKKVLELKRDGFTYRQIIKKLNISKSSYYSIINEKNCYPSKEGGQQEDKN